MVIGDIEMKNEFVFKLKSMFEPNDVLARWIIKLSMMRNDLFYVRKSLIPYFLEDEPMHDGFLTYNFRQCASHYKEAVKFIYNYSENEVIKAFLKRLPDEAIKNYSQVLDSCTPWTGSFVHSIVMPIRDNFYHYTDKTFKKDYEELADIFTRMIVEGKNGADIDLVFADEISMNVIFGNKSEKEISDIVMKLSDYMVALIKFVDQAIAAYFYHYKHRASYIVRNNK